MVENDLDAVYREAQSALKSRDYVRASELLRQILVIDENYKDVSRLLAQTVKLKRRRWYHHPVLWWTVIGVAVISLIIWVVPKLPQRTSSAPAPPTVSFTATALPTETLIPTATPSPMPTAIPLTWKRVSIGQDFERDTVMAFVINPKDQDVLYAGMKNAGIYKSIDGGLSWRPSHFGLSNTHVQSLSIDPKNPQSLYAGTMGEIFQTEDGGENWSKISARTYLLMDSQDGSHLYSRDSDGIYESTDGGKNWKSVYSSKEECPGEILGWAIHPTDGNTLFVGGGEKCKPGVYLSSDRGHTWTLLAKREIRPGGYTIHDMGLDNLTIGLDRQDNFYIRMNARVSSFERGVKHDENGYWKTILELDDKPIVFDSASSVYFHCDTHLCKFNLDESQRVTLGMPDVGIFTNITISPDEPKIIYVTGKGISVSKDGGVTWTKLNNGLGATLLTFEIGERKPSILYLQEECDNSYFPYLIEKSGYLTDSHGRKEPGQLLFTSNDGGQTWDLISKTGCYLIKDADGTTLYRIARAIQFCEGCENADGWIWRSQDRGQTWNKAMTPHQYWNLRTLVAHPTQSGMLFASNSEEQFISKDYGNKWERMDPTLGYFPCYGETLRFIYEYRPMAIDPLDGDHVFVIDNGTLLESHNSCDTTETFATPPNMSMNSIAFDPNKSSTIYAGTDDGAYISSDGGMTWGQVNDGLLGATVVYSIVVDKDGNVYAATPYGVFKLEGK